MIILGGVPIFVFIPPKIEANARGIKNFDGDQDIFWHIPKVTGKSIAIAPILFMNEESTTAIPIKMTRNWNSLLAIF